MTRALLFLELVLGVAAGIAAWSMHGEGGEARGAVLFAAVPLVGIAVLGTALVAARDGGGLTPSAGAVRLLAYLAVGAALLQVVRFSPFVPATFFLLLHVAIATGAVILLLRRGRRASFAWRAADVAAGALVILLVGGEIGVRIFAATSPGPLFVQRDMPPRDRIAAFRFRPGTIVDGTAANEQGVVGPPLARAADGRTVALVSDRALGGGLPYARGVAALATQPGLTFVHAALDGLSTPEYRALADDVVLPIAPDALIVVVDLNDDLAELDRDESAWRPLASWLDRDNVLTALTLTRVSAALAERARLGQAEGAQPAAIAATDDEIARDFPWIDDPLAEPPRLSDERLAELQRRALDANAGPTAARLADRATVDLAAIAAACAAANIAFGVAVLPARYQIEKDLWSALRGELPDGARDAPQHALRARLAARDIAVLDLTPALRAAQPWSDGRAHVFHRGDVRLNARGNRLCAAALAGFAARLLAGRAPR